MIAYCSSREQHYNRCKGDLYGVHMKSTIVAYPDMIDIIEEQRLLVTSCFEHNND